MSYVVSTLAIPPTHLIARIGAKNTASIKLFEKLGFGVVRFVEVFDEVEMRWGWDAVRGEQGRREWREEELEGRMGVYDPPTGEGAAQVGPEEGVSPG